MALDQLVHEGPAPAHAEAVSSPSPRAMLRCLFSCSGPIDRSSVSAVRARADARRRSAFRWRGFAPAGRRWRDRGRSRTISVAAPISLAELDSRRHEDDCRVRSRGDDHRRRRRVSAARGAARRRPAVRGAPEVQSRLLVFAQSRRSESSAWKLDESRCLVRDADASRPELGQGLSLAEGGKDGKSATHASHGTQGMSTRLTLSLSWASNKVPRSNVRRMAVACTARRTPPSR